MSIVCLSHVMRHSEATLGARLVVFVLAEFAHDDGSKAFPAVETIMERTRMSRRGVQEALRRLEAEGEVVKTGVTKAGTSIYRIVLDRGAESARGGAVDDAAGAQLTTSRGAVAAPNPSMTQHTDPSGKKRASAQTEHPDFAEWLGNHQIVTGIPVLKAGSAGRRKIAGMFGARREEGLSLADLKAATKGAFHDPYRREHGYFDPESVLRPTKVAKLVMLGRRVDAAPAPHVDAVDWSRFDA